MGENKLDSCNCTIIHKDVVEKVKGKLTGRRNFI